MKRLETQLQSKRGERKGGRGGKSSCGKVKNEVEWRKVEFEDDGNVQFEQKRWGRGGGNDGLTGQGTNNFLIF